jgi:hypothetical protein
MALVSRLSARPVKMLFEPPENTLICLPITIWMERLKSLGKDKTGLAMIIVSAIAFIITLILINSLITNPSWTFLDTYGDGYRWAVDLEYSEEINLDLVSATMETEEFEIRDIYFHEDTWESDNLFGENTPGMDRIWNIDFNYNITIDIEEYTITNDTLEQLDFMVDEQNGTIELLIDGSIYNNHYDDGSSVPLDMYNAYIMGPYSDYGIIFDGIPWQQIFEDEMPNFIQLIEDATGQEPDSAKVTRLYR